MSLWLFLLAGAGVWLLVEGALCALAPDLVRRLGEHLARFPAKELSIAGLVMSALGLGLLLVAVSSQ